MGQVQLSDREGPDDLVDVDVVVVIVAVVAAVVAVVVVEIRFCGSAEARTTRSICQSVMRRSVFRETASTLDFGGKKVAFIS